MKLTEYSYSSNHTTAFSVMAQAFRAEDDHVSTPANLDSLYSKNSEEFLKTSFKQVRIMS